MANINVETRGGSIWPWILGLVVAALLIWALMGMFDSEDDELEIEPATQVEPTLETVPVP